MAPIVTHQTRKTLAHLSEDVLEESAARARATIARQWAECLPTVPGQLWERVA